MIQLSMGAYFFAGGDIAGIPRMSAPFASTAFVGPGVMSDIVPPCPRIPIMLLMTSATFDSESIRNWAEVTTRWPDASPLRTST